jgi:D-glycero-D-manno-heptose 1,7-bisphosphate phosphatase
MQSRSIAPDKMASRSLRSAVFLDRDGVINENRPDHVKSWDEFVFLPDIFDPLHQLTQDGRSVVVVSNQAAINRGLVDQETVKQINRQMCGEIARRGGRIDAVYFCPHRPDEGCDCRKPRPGLLLRAANEMGLDLARSYLVGDALSDIEAARAAGCSPILVLSGRGEQQLRLLRQRQLDDIPVVQDLAEAIAFICAKGQLTGICI